MSEDRKDFVLSGGAGPFPPPQPPAMTLLDAFAIAALPGAIEDYDRQTRSAMGLKDYPLPHACRALSREDIIANQAYRYGEAMLRAREGRA